MSPFIGPVDDVLVNFNSPSPLGKMSVVKSPCSLRSTLVCLLWVSRLLDLLVDLIGSERAALADRCFSSSPFELLNGSQHVSGEALSDVGSYP